MNNWQKRLKISYWKIGVYLCHFRFYPVNFRSTGKKGLNNNNNIFISYIKYTSITPPANSKAIRGRWCGEDGLRLITIVEVKKSTIFIIKRVSHESN